MPFDAENVKSSPSTSLADKVKVSEASSSMTWSAIASTTGASLTGVTDNVKLSVPAREPSLADTVTVISPL